MTMTIRGTVVRGKGEGRRLGYPTANLLYEGEQIETGVYIVNIKSQISNGAGLAIVGMWKLANGLPSIEVFIMNGEHDLYGAEMTIEIGRRLRGLMTFRSAEELKEQIKIDIEYAHVHPMPDQI